MDEQVLVPVQPCEGVSANMPSELKRYHPDALNRLEKTLFKGMIKLIRGNQSTRHVEYAMQTLVDPIKSR